MTALCHGISRRPEPSRDRVPRASTPRSPAVDNSVWADAMAQIGAAGDRLVAAMHERGEADVDADVYVTLLGALMDTYLNRVSGEADHPTFVPCCGYYQHLGSPNPDTVYRRAPVDDTATYRLTGERGTAWQVTIMPFTEMMQGFTPFDLSEVAREPDGHFDVLVSRERPAGYDGDWWPLEAGHRELVDPFGVGSVGRRARPAHRDHARRRAAARAPDRRRGAQATRRARVHGRAHRRVRHAPHRRAHRRGLRQPAEDRRLRQQRRDAAPALPRGRVPARRRRGAPGGGAPARGCRLLLVVTHRPDAGDPRLDRTRRPASTDPRPPSMPTACCASS